MVASGRQEFAVRCIEVPGGDVAGLIGQPEGVSLFIEVIEIGFTAHGVDGLQELTARRVEVIPRVGSGAVTLDKQRRQAHAVVPDEVLRPGAGSP